MTTTAAMTAMAATAAAEAAEAAAAEAAEAAAAEAAAAEAAAAEAAAAAAAARPVDEAVKRKRDEHWAQLREVTKAARKEVGEVESIQASREPVDRSSEKEYLVKWKGFDEKYNTWRKASELADMRVQALIDEFEAAPEAPGADVAEVCV